MGNPHRPLAQSRPARAARFGRSFAKFVLLGMVGVASYAGLTGGAFGPPSEFDVELPETLQVATASLSYSATTPQIEGSVADLFASASFTGPNRAQKTDRLRPKADLVAFSRNFEEARTRIAALRTQDLDTQVLGQSRIADAAIKAPVAGVDVGPRISVASINPDAAAALDAIAGIAPSGNGSPIPVQASEQLAYARATAPEESQIPEGFTRGKAVQVSDKERWCLSTAIYFEARGESYRGQVAVAQVVMNRVKDHRYPNTICGVVFQNQNKRNACQFSFACDGIPEVVNDNKSWAQAEDISKRLLDGNLYLTEVADSTHYHATYVRPAWAPRMQKVTQIGLHVFYKFKRGWLFG